MNNFVRSFESRERGFPGLGSWRNQFPSSVGEDPVWEEEDGGDEQQDLRHPHGGHAGHGGGGEDHTQVHTKVPQNNTLLKLTFNLVIWM